MIKDGSSHAFFFLQQTYGIFEWEAMTKKIKQLTGYDRDADEKYKR